MRRRKRTTPTMPVGPPGGTVRTGWRHLVRLGLLSLIVTIGGCGVSDPDLEANGVVEYVGVEGGCWTIDVGEKRLEPINLPETFKEDGLRVSVVANEVEAASICQVGELVQIQEIEAIR